MQHSSYLLVPKARIVSCPWHCMLQMKYVLQIDAPQTVQHHQRFCQLVQLRWTAWHGVMHIPFPPAANRQRAAVVATRQVAVAAMGMHAASQQEPVCHLCA